MDGQASSLLDFLTGGLGSLCGVENAPLQNSAISGPRVQAASPSTIPRGIFCAYTRWWVEDST